MNNVYFRLSPVRIITIINFTTVDSPCRMVVVMMELILVRSTQTAVSPNYDMTTRRGIQRECPGVRAKRNLFATSVEAVQMWVMVTSTCTVILNRRTVIYIT